MALLAAVCSGQAQNGEEYYVKHLDFPQGATPVSYTHLTLPTNTRV
mgnify:CR=1 FL=1